MPSEAVQPEVEGVEVDSGSMLASLDKATIDVQITTARAYPRSIDKFRKDALALATSDEITARSMFYILPRDGKKIEGATIRMAEVIGSCWGNIRYGARIVDIGESFVTAQGMALDLEKNIAITLNVQRRIKNKYGQRYNDDMISTTANAAMSIALRNAILRVVPGWKGIYEAAREASTGKGKTMKARVEAALQALKDIGAKPDEVLRVLNRRGAPDITIDDLITLNGMFTAIKDGETTWAQILDDLPKTEEEIKRDLKTNIDDAGADIAADRKKEEPPKKVEPEVVTPEDPTLNDEDQAMLRAAGKAAGMNPKQLREWLFQKIDVTDEGDVRASQVSALQAALEALTKG